MKNTTDKIACPFCSIPSARTAKFCSECGAALTDTVPDRAWIAAEQERIKQYRQNDLTFNICAALGAIIAVALPFVMRYAFKYNMDMLSWLLTGAGLVLFVGGIAGLWWDDSRVKKSIEELKYGPTDEYEDEEEEDDEADEDDGDDDSDE